MLQKFLVSPLASVTVPPMAWLSRLREVLGLFKPKVAHSLGFERPTCRVFLVPPAAARSGSWRQLLEELRSCQEEVPGAVVGRERRRALPFRDMILTGPQDLDRLRATSLRRALRDEFFQARGDFNTFSIFEPAQAELKVFYGVGIYAPEVEDQPVADLQFSWQRPDSDGVVPASSVITPTLGEAGTGGSGHPAAWYAGQQGVALGFARGGAPAFITRDINTPKNTLSDQLEKARLFIGRRDRLSSPVFLLDWVEPTARHVKTRCEYAGDWWLRNGEWQSILFTDLDNNEELPLWFRLTTRTGDCLLRRDMDGPSAPADSPGPRLVVTGLLVPELPSLRIWSWLLSGQPTRWSIEFDRRGALRTQDIFDLCQTAVAQWGTRFAIYRHHEERWLERSAAFDGFQEFPLTGSQRIRNAKFPGRRQNAKQTGRAEWLRIYGRAWGLCDLGDADQTFGTIDVEMQSSRLFCEPIVGAPVRETRGAVPSAVQEIGLDWLNRAVKVKVAGKIMGLATYWGRQWDVTFMPSDTQLAIEVKDLRRDRVMKYSIPVGESGPLGPLYIEYRID